MVVISCSAGQGLDAQPLLPSLSRQLTNAVSAASWSERQNPRLLG